eukprot:gene9558-6849_t
MDYLPLDVAEDDSWCGQLDVDLIEMMACPSSCGSGGGRLKNDNQWLSPAEATATKALPESISESKERVVSVKALKGPPAPSPSPSYSRASMRQSIYLHSQYLKIFVYII